MAAESTIAGRAGGGQADEAGGGTARRSLGMIVVMTGVLITAVDTTIVVLALPAIERELHVALSSVIWVVIGYLLVITLLATQVGRLGDMFGRVRMYEAGFAVFVIGSVLCALAWNEGAIIGFRIVQAVGGAFVTANSGAVIADLYPPKERGRAYGFNAVGWSMGAVLGVVLGGTIVTYVSWRWIFWINVPIGVAALVLAVRVLHERSERVRRRLDPAGMLALGLGLFGVLWAMTKLASAPLDAEQVGYLIGGVIMLAVFVVIELRQREPMLDLSLFKIPVMAPSLLASLFQGLASFAVLFLIIMYLQGPRGLTPIHASLLLVPGYVIGSAFGPLARPGGRPGRAGHPGHRRAGHPGRRAVHLRAPGDRQRAVAGGGGQRGQQHRRQLLLPGQQRGGDEGLPAGDARHLLGRAADVREHRDGVLLHDRHPDRLALHLAGPRVRHLRGHDQPARTARGGVHDRPARGVLHDDGLHGHRRRPVRGPWPRRDPPGPPAQRERPGGVRAPAPGRSAAT